PVLEVGGIGLDRAAFTEDPRKPEGHGGESAQDVHLRKPRLHQLRPRFTHHAHELPDDTGVVTSARGERMQACPPGPQRLRVGTAIEGRHVHLMAQVDKPLRQIHELPLRSAATHVRDAMEDPHPTYRASRAESVSATFVAASAIPVVAQNAYIEKTSS